MKLCSKHKNRVAPGLKSKINITKLNESSCVWNSFTYISFFLPSFLSQFCDQMIKPMTKGSNAMHEMTINKSKERSNTKN